ncbi:MAG: RidA family protein [Anaerolineaceae bacterium]|jgi:2-iminobutanoate/2-iminopropanoate deaminase|nr:RidA family protein [Anaerolineaceae bacterium]MDD4042720.1 RidA family protein [Anaerolineaceae bacterium]MDD4577071.1 RidA family protein [Anaerolineaceae bacterium]
MSCCCTKKEIISCENAPAAIGPYSVAVSTGSLVFISGQLGLDKDTGSLVAGGIQAQTRKALENMKAILESAGLSMENVVKTTVFLLDMGQFSDMNSVYAEFFTSDFPARSAIQVGGLPKNGIVEIEAVAVNPCDCQDENCCCQ